MLDMTLSLTAPFLFIDAAEISFPHTLRTQPGTAHDNGRDGHECGGNKTADCAENKHDGCDPQARPEFTDKYPNPKGTVSKAQPQCQESGGPQSSFGRRITFTGTPKGRCKDRGGQKIKDHSDAEKLTYRPSVNTGIGIGQNRWNHADGNQEGNSNQ